MKTFHMDLYADGLDTTLTVEDPAELINRFDTVMKNLAELVGPLERSMSILSKLKEDALVDELSERVRELTGDTHRAILSRYPSLNADWVFGLRYDSEVVISFIINK